jgi:hypothetical protein
MATLRELDSEPFEIVPADELPVTAPSDRWAVLVGTEGPVTALPPGGGLAPDARPPEILIAVAGLDQATAFASPAFDELAEVGALVLIEAGSASDAGPAIAGVVSGQTLFAAVFRRVDRGVSEAVLPGTPLIPLISRSCGFSESGVGCVTPMSFSHRPSPMPPCPNGRQLSGHAFVW